jgi:hypothetical protein
VIAYVRIHLLCSVLINPLDLILIYPGFEVSASSGPGDTCTRISPANSDVTICNTGDLLVSRPDGALQSTFHHVTLSTGAYSAGSEVQAYVC